MGTHGAIRATERYPVQASIEVTHPRSVRRLDAELRDLSNGGCKIVSPERFSLGDQLLLTIEGLEPWPAAVAWTGEGCVGVSFHRPLDQSIAEHYARVFR